MKNIIVLQHIKIEDPGYIKDLMLEDKVHIKTVEPVSYTHLRAHETN